MATVVDSKKSDGGSPYHYYSMAIAKNSSTRTGSSLSFDYSITIKLASSSSSVGTGPLVVKFRIGDSTFSYTARANGTWWYGTESHTKTGTVTVTGLENNQTSVITKISANNEGGTSGDLSTYQGASYSIPARTHYTVSYNVNGGSGSAPASQTKWYGTALTLSSASVGTKTGYTRNGWNTNTSGTGTHYAAGGSYTANASDTLYAQWDPNKYIIAFNANGGTGTMSSLTNRSYGTEYTLTTNSFTRTGYSFQGWATSSSGSVAYSNGATVKNLSSTNGATVTLYAVWKAKTAIATFNANGGSFGTVSTTTITETYGSPTQLPTNPTRTGYSFNGWSPTPPTTWNSETAVTYTAQWAANTYTITYNANGGSGGTSSGTVSYGGSFTTPTSANSPTRNSYTFLGWSESNTAMTATYTANQTISGYSRTTGLTLYAVWKLSYTAPSNFKFDVAKRDNSDETKATFTLSWTNGIEADGTTIKAPNSIVIKYRRTNASSSDPWTTLTTLVNLPSTATVTTSYSSPTNTFTEEYAYDIQAVLSVTLNSQTITQTISEYISKATFIMKIPAPGLNDDNVYFGRPINAPSISDGNNNILSNKIDTTDAVIGVKGNSESTYRKGNVNLTPDNIGAVPSSDVSTNGTYGTIPKMTSAGVLEVGKYIDFHNTSGSGDYDIRLASGTDGTLKVNSNTVITANALTSFFVVETYQSTITGTGTQSWTPTKTKSGYYPLGIVGYRLDSTSSSYLNVYICRLTDVASGTCGIEFYVRNTSSTSASANLYINVLWMKTS